MVYLGSVNARCCCGKWKWRKQLTKNSVVKRSWIISGKKKKIILYAIGSLVICKKEKGRRRKQNKKRSFFVFFFPRFVFTFRKTPPLHGFSREFVVEKRPSSSILWRWMNEGFFINQWIIWDQGSNFEIGFHFILSKVCTSKYRG